MFLVKLPDSRKFIVPKNLKLLAVPFCQIHENDKVWNFTSFILVNFQLDSSVWWITMVLSHLGTCVLYRNNLWVYVNFIDVCFSIWIYCLFFVRPFQKKHYIIWVSFKKHKMCFMSMKVNNNFFFMLVLKHFKVYISKPILEGLKFEGLIYCFLIVIWCNRHMGLLYQASHSCCQSSHSTSSNLKKRLRCNNQQRML